MDDTSGHKLLSFIDTLSGYNQIWMATEDEENMTSITKRSLYYYKMMSFGLKNIKATDQCLVNNVFKYQMSHNMQVYVDGMLVKNTKTGRHITNLEEAFGELRQHYMKLNPNKYTFGMMSENFFRFIMMRWELRLI